MGMRITNTMLVNKMTNYISGNLNKLQKYQYMIANGKKIQLPSDDPVVASRALKLRTDVAEVEQYTSNVSDATSWVETTEGALGNLGDVMQRIRELTVQAASDQNDDDDLAKINEEIKQLKKQVVTIANSTYAGRYIFSGFSTDQKLLDDDGAFRISISKKEDINFEIGINDNFNVNVRGGDLFNNGKEAVGPTSASVTSTEALTFPLDTSGDISVNIDTTFTLELTDQEYENSEALVAGLQNDLNTQLGTNKVSVKFINGILKFTDPNNEEAAISIEATAFDNEEEIEFPFNPAGDLVVYSNEIVDVPLASKEYANIDELVKGVQKDIDDALGSEKVHVSYEGEYLKFANLKKGSNSSIKVESFELGMYGNETMVVGTNGDKGQIISHIDELIENLAAGDNEAVGLMLEKIDSDINNILRVRSDIGARQNRLELTNNRLNSDTVNFTRLLSVNEDVDMAQTVMELQNESNVYNASLSAGAKIILPTLVDFLK